MSQSDNPRFLWKPEMILLRLLFFVICIFDTLLVRIVSPERFFWRQLSHLSESSFWFIILVYLCTFFWGWYSQILTLTERGGKEDIKREETISSISLPYFVLLQRSKNQRRRKAQKFKRTQTKFLRNFWEFESRSMDRRQRNDFISVKNYYFG